MSPNYISLIVLKMVKTKQANKNKEKKQFLILNFLKQAKTEII